MTSSFKSRFWQLSKWFGGLFIALFIFRFIYGFVAPDAGNNGESGRDFFSSLDNVRKNYASEKFSKSGNDVQIQANSASNQKFEKTASIKAKSSEFEADEKNIKEIGRASCRERV